MSEEPLQAPGAGLPGLESAFLTAFFKFGTAVMSDRSALKMFNKESDRLLQGLARVLHSFLLGP